MPSTKGQGQSKSTPLKQESLKAIFKQHLAICSKNIFSRHDWANPVYHYIDMNAGSGHNPIFDCAGSPLIFLEAVSLVDIQYRAYLIEIDPKHCSLLAEKIAPWDNCKILIGDNSDLTSRLIRKLRRNTFGILYQDYNGIPNFELMASLSRMPQSSRLDFLIRCPAAAVKRNYHQHHTKLVDYLKAIKKKYWIIKELERGDNWQWTFLFGLNTDKMKAWKKQGFHYVHSRHGQEIIRQLNYTKDELNEFRQPALF